MLRRLDIWLQDFRAAHRVKFGIVAAQTVIVVLLILIAAFLLRVGLGAL